jgi:hypothetical protein
MVNKEVKVILNLVRMKVDAAHPKIVSVVAPKRSASTNKNSAKATVTGLKPGQKVKVTVNVKPRP